MGFSLDESNLEFIESKGFDIKSLDGLKKARCLNDFADICRKDIP